MVPLRPTGTQIKSRSKRQAFGAIGLNGVKNVQNSPVAFKPKFGDGENVLSADNGYGLEANANPSRTTPNVAAGGTATPVVNNPNNPNNVNNDLEEVFGTANNNQFNQATNGQLNQGGQVQNPPQQTGTNTWGEATQVPNNPWLAAGGGGFPVTNPAPVPGYNPVPVTNYNPVPNNPWLSTPETYRPVIPGRPSPHWPHFGGYTPSTEFQFPQSWRTIQHHHNYKNCKH